MRLREYLARNRTVASITVLAVLLAAPVTAAVLYEGFPVDDVDLMARDVWVTNSGRALTGRLNMQIEELNGSVRTPGSAVDVFQDGDDVFVFDGADDSIVRVDPSFTTLGQRIELRNGSDVAYGGGRLAVLDPQAGDLWTVDATTDLRFDAADAPPLLAGLGSGAVTVVSLGGTVFTLAPEQAALYRQTPDAVTPEQIATLEVRDFALTTVGEHVVVLDRDVPALIFEDGSRVEIDGDAVRLQQPGPDRDSVIVAVEDRLLRVGFDHVVTQLGETIARPSSSADDIAAPAVVGSCVHAAWRFSATYIGACDGRDTVSRPIPEFDGAGRLEFRVNRSVVALNDLATGDVWLVDDDITAIDANWDEVEPPEPLESEEQGEETTQESFEDLIARRTDQNNPPIARPDSLGARPSRATILPVLDNDTDPDGDVLTIDALSDLPATSGTLTLIDGGRSLQFMPAAGASGTVTFRYTVSDGRPGGLAEAQVDVAIRSETDNTPPEQIRTTTTKLETKQTLTYNVLNDFRDPDGDVLQVVAAAVDTEDVVRFTPDGLITFTSVSTTLGAKKVTVTVSDGRPGGVTVGEVVFEVMEAGSMRPVGTPDFATGFVGDWIEIRPLENDESPSGVALTLGEVTALTPGVTVRSDPTSGLVRVSAGAGTFYLQYDVVAGPQKAPGLIRVDVREDPDNPLPPIAVTDTAYIRPSEPLTIPVLANDVSPSGRVLGIQSVEVPVGSPLTVALLANTVVRATAASAMTEPATFRYTISDGESTSTTDVTVIPVPPPTQHRAPIAAEDRVTVRAGDFATVDVLANDHHPDGTRMILDPEIVASNLDPGVAFVTDDRVRIQAPGDPGQYAVTYRISDRFGEASTARIVVTVTTADAESNQSPAPLRVEARVFQGANVFVELPLDGIDPDGDSVVLTGVAGGTQGAVSAQTLTGFSYTAAADGHGTDVLTYTVRDGYGKSGSADVHIAVIPRPATSYPPVAIDDEVSIRPGRTATVPVLANDSDPNGLSIALEQVLDVPADLSAAISDDGSSVVVEAGPEEQTLFFRYRVGNGVAPSSVATVIVHIDADAVVGAPTAIDHVVEAADAVGLESVEIDVRRGASNPGGLVSDLEIEVYGPNSEAATVDQATGIVTVKLNPDARKAIAYRLVNTVDNRSASAFLVVPRYSTAEPPRLKQQYLTEPEVVAINDSRTWNIADLLDVPSGRRVFIIDQESASATRSSQPLVVDDHTIRYTPDRDYRGEATLVFTVTDGDSATDPSGNVAVIRMPVIVGRADARDIAPTFSDAVVRIEGGETPTAVDLRAASAHPNPEVVGELTYTDLQQPGGVISASIDGSTLSVAAPRTAPQGTTATFTFRVNSREFSGGDAVLGSVTVVVVASTRPLAIAVDDIEPEGRSNSSYTLDVLANDFNPFGGEEPLEIISAVLENPSPGASVTATPTAVQVSTGSLISGTLSIIYVVRDSTGDPDRHVQGRASVVVASAPEPVTSFTLTNSAAEAVTVVFQPTSSTNGAPITSYTVRIVGTGGTQQRVDCLPGESCTFTGRPQGTVQTVDVAATNRVGTTWSTTRTIVPLGTPSPPTNVILSTNSANAPATITPTWSGASDSGGGSLSYEWEYTLGTTGSGTTTGTSGDPKQVGEGDYGFQVRACNPSACSPWAPAARYINFEPPSVPTSVTLATTSATEPATITPTWAASATTGGTAVSYEWAYTAGVTGGGTTTTLSGTAQVVNEGSYSFQVRACNAGGCSGWVTASRTVGSAVPSVPTSVSLPSTSTTAPATITPTWGVPAYLGAGTISYEWSYTQGETGGGTVSGTTGTARSVGVGDYAFQVRACTPAGCSAYVSATRNVASPFPTVPTNVVLNSSSATSPATITPTWGAPTWLGAGTITYEWAYTQGYSTTGQTASLAGTAQSNVAVGDYAFRVRACTPAPGGCSDWVTATRNIASPVPSAPTGVNLARSGSTAPATITPRWGAPTWAGAGTLTYQWRYTQNVSGSGTTSSTSGNAASVGAGTYSFEVRACTPAPGGCSAYVSASTTISAPPRTVALTKGASAASQSGCTSGNCWFLHIEVRNFAPNTQYSAECNAGSGYYHSQNITTNSSGSWGGDLNCWSGFGSTTARVSSVVSNTW